MKKIIKHRRKIIDNAQFTLDVIIYRNELIRFLKKNGYSKKRSLELFKKILDF